MKQRLLSILLNPYVMAFAISAIVIWLMPDYFSKYQVTLESSEYVNGHGNKAYYTDLDGDHKSEKIVAQTNSLGNASFLFFDSDNNFIDQYNFEGEFLNATKNIWFQDANGNTIKEIYIVTRVKDTAYLYEYEPIDLKIFKPHKVYVDTISQYNNDYWVSFETTTSFPRHDIKDPHVLFMMSAGFSCYPRNMYQYDFNSKTILKSPHITNSFGLDYRTDLDGDGKLEYLLSCNSPGNDNAIKFSGRSDYSTWLTVLDDDLQFLFEPIGFEGLGATQLVPIEQESAILGCFWSKNPSITPSKLFKIDLKGELLNEVELPNFWYTDLFGLENEHYGLYETENGSLQIFDANLNLTNTLSLMPNLAISKLKMHTYSKSNWIGFHKDGQTAIIWDENFEHPVTFKFSDLKGGTFNSGIKLKGPKQSQIYFQKDNDLKLYSYSENPFYYFKYATYVGIYALVLFIIWLIIKGQKLREAKERAIEQEIADLQLKTIKNQVDPHFVFNAINTISEMTLMDNKLEADAFIGRFSGFMRDTLMHSDKISTTLKDELDYTENFIQLQQIRFNHRFKYQIHIDKGVDLDTLIPKHVLFTYAENAIKHGLRGKDQGLLQLRVSKNKEQLKLCIEDNGGGLRQSAAPKSHSTGSGLGIMEHIFELYTKRYKRNIKHEVKDVYDDQKQISGLRVNIYIEHKTN